MRRKIPNILSSLRVAISPVFYVLFLSGIPNLIAWSFVLYTIGAITDYFDGWFARKMKAMTAWGKFFDPLADKFLTSAAFLAFASMGFIPYWMVIIIIIRDFGTTFLRLFKFSSKELVTSKTAKAKTLFQMIFIFSVILLYLLAQFTGYSTQAFINGILYSSIVYISMLIITALTVWSLIEYIYFMFFKAD